MIMTNTTEDLRAFLRSQLPRRSCAVAAAIALAAIHQDHDASSVAELTAALSAAACRPLMPKVAERFAAIWVHAREPITRSELIEITDSHSSTIVTHLALLRRLSLVRMEGTTPIVAADGRAYPRPTYFRTPGVIPDDVKQVLSEFSGLLHIEPKPPAADEDDDEAPDVARTPAENLARGCIARLAAGEWSRPEIVGTSSVFNLARLAA